MTQKKKEYLKQYYQDNKERLDYIYKRNRWLKQYGLTEEDYQGMLSKQNFSCAICENADEPLRVDHCHTTGKVRGLLCHRCNTGLGLFKDNVRNLETAIRYLSNVED